MTEPASLRAKVQLLGGIRPLSRGYRLGSDRAARLLTITATGQEEKRDDVLWGGNREGCKAAAERRNCTQDADQAGEKRRPEPISDGAREHCG